MRILLAAVLAALVGCDDGDPGPEDSGTPDTGPQSCEECRQRGLCMAGIEDVCPREGACVAESHDGGAYDSCFENGVRTRSVSLGSIPYNPYEMTRYSPEGDVCYRVTVMDHWKPHNLPPGTEARSLDYVMPDGGTMHVGLSAYSDSYGRIECNGQPVQLLPGCEPCMPKLPARVSCTQGPCQAP